MKHQPPQTTAYRRIADLSDLMSADVEANWRLARELRQEWRRERYSRLTGG
jgi:hypothetical protein